MSSGAAGGTGSRRVSGGLPWRALSAWVVVDEGPKERCDRARAMREDNAAEQ